MSELKPCPFCGCVNLGVQGGPLAQEQYSIHCACGLSMTHPLREHLIAKWNTRQDSELIATQDALKVAVGALSLCRNVLANSGGHSFAVSEADELLSNPAVKKAMGE